MKLFFSEFKPNYDKYSFPYQVWLLKEEGDLVESIYQVGFLPTRHLKNIYYLSRSLRVDLDLFETSSENKRILNKTSDFEADLIPLSDFDYTPAVQKMCKDYAEAKMGKGVFSSQTIKNIFNNGIYNYVFIFKKISDQSVVGYAVCFISGNLIQYAHSFYNSNYIGQNLGARMILQSVVWGKQNNKRYAYLGTCYQRESLYKTEFKGVNFFNGFRWSENIQELKKLITGIEEEEYLLKNKKFIEEFYSDGLQNILSKYGVKVNL
jgi:arginyl-tRNA--protein-N-Asp/Glu arginylyltransferase